MELRDKVEELLANADSPVIRQDHEVADAEVVRFNSGAGDGNEFDGFLIFGDVPLDSGARI
jgi:hypothetical protein